MISRRHLIGSGVAVSALGLVGRVTSASPAPLFANKVIVDTRFNNALVIARETAAPGARFIALPRDVLELWHDHLAPAPSRAPQAFAGVTTEHAFFTLRTLAADHRQRVLYSAVHAGQRGDEPLISWVIGPAASRA